MNNAALRLAGAAVLVMVAIAAGAWLRSAHGPGGRSSSSGIRVPAGESSAPNPSDAVPLTSAPLTAGMMPASNIPERLPAFALGDRDGKLTSIDEYAGKSLVLNFWATWCGPCRREIPLLQSLHAEWSGSQVEVIGIAVDYRENVRQFADNLKIAYPLLIGEQDALDVAASLGVSSPVFPFTVFTDRRGEVVALFVGEMHRPQAEVILSVVRKLDQQRLSLADARHAIATGLTALQPEPTH